jgi:hypothetical protein
LWSQPADAAAAVSGAKLVRPGQLLHSRAKSAGREGVVNPEELLTRGMPVPGAFAAASGADNDDDDDCDSQAEGDDVVSGWTRFVAVTEWCPHALQPLLRPEFGPGRDGSRSLGASVLHDEPFKPLSQSDDGSAEWYGAGSMEVAMRMREHRRMLHFIRTADEWSRDAAAADDDGADSFIDDDDGGASSSLAGSNAASAHLAGGVFARFGELEFDAAFGLVSRRLQATLAVGGFIDGVVGIDSVAQQLQALDSGHGGPVDDSGGSAYPERFGSDVPPLPSSAMGGARRAVLTNVFEAQPQIQSGPCADDDGALKRRLFSDVREVVSVSGLANPVEGASTKSRQPQAVIAGASSSAAGQAAAVLPIARRAAMVAAGAATSQGVPPSGFVSQAKPVFGAGYAPMPGAKRSAWWDIDAQIDTKKAPPPRAGSTDEDSSLMTEAMQRASARAAILAAAAAAKKSEPENSDHDSGSDSAVASSMTPADCSAASRATRTESFRHRRANPNFSTIVEEGDGDIADEASSRDSSHSTISSESSETGETGSDASDGRVGGRPHATMANDNGADLAAPHIADSMPDPVPHTLEAVMPNVVVGLGAALESVELPSHTPHPALAAAAAASQLAPQGQSRPLVIDALPRQASPDAAAGEAAAAWASLGLGTQDEWAAISYLVHQPVCPAPPEPLVPRVPALASRRAAPVAAADHVAHEPQRSHDLLSLGCEPLAAVCRRDITGVLRAQAALVSSALVAGFLASVHVADHLRALRAVFFFEQDAHMAAFTRPLFESLRVRSRAGGGGASVGGGDAGLSRDSVRLTSLLQAALAPLAPRRRRFRGGPRAERGAVGAGDWSLRPMAFSCAFVGFEAPSDDAVVAVGFRIGYQAAFPLSVLITPAALDEYNAIFGQLLRVHRVLALATDLTVEARGVEREVLGVVAHAAFRSYGGTIRTQLRILQGHRHMLLLFVRVS